MAIRIGTPRKWMSLTVKGVLSPGLKATLRENAHQLEEERRSIKQLWKRHAHLVAPTTDRRPSRYTDDLANVRNDIRYSSLRIRALRNNVRKNWDDARSQLWLMFPINGRMVNVCHFDTKVLLHQKRVVLSQMRRKLREFFFRTNRERGIPFQVGKHDQQWPIDGRSSAKPLKDPYTTSVYHQLMTIHLVPGHFLLEADRLLRQKVKSYKLPGTFEPHVGVEIECYVVSSRGRTQGPRESLEESLTKAGLWRYVMCGTDVSLNQFPAALRIAGNIHAFEGVELRVLAPEQALVDVIRKICAVLRSHRAVVNRSCGMHVHFDCRPETGRVPETVYTRLYSALPLLMHLVPWSRRTYQGDDGQPGSENHFCFYNRATDLNTAMSYSRYQAINPNSLTRHQTIEVRLHQGTTNPSKIINWVALLLAFINGPDVKSIPTNLPDLQELLGLSPALVKYLEERLTTMTPASTADPDGPKIIPFLDRRFLFTLHASLPDAPPPTIEKPKPGKRTTPPPEALPSPSPPRWSDLNAPRYLPPQGGERIIVQPPPPPEITLGNIFAQVEGLLTDPHWE